MAFVLPTYFTAVNGISPTMLKIGADMNRLGARAQAAQAQMNGFLPSFGGIGKSMGHMLPALATAGIIASVALSGKAISDYGVEISNLSAVTGATGAQLDIFKGKIRDVAKATKRSTVETAQAFTTVDNNMPELHKLPEDLAKVTEATITLAKASRMELQPSAEAMTMTMHQFALTAKDATHVVDVMAAGAVYGSSRIAETSEALQKFGAAAKNVLNVTYEESVGLVELASRFEKGSEAGTRLRNILLTMGTIKAKPELAQELNQLGINVDVVTDKTKPLIDRLTELSKVQHDAILMEKLFDKRNITMASGVFQRIDKFQGILDGLKAEGLGAQMAETNTDNLKGSVDKLVASWVTMITTSSQTSAGVKLLSGTMKILANYLEWITTVTVLSAEAFFGWKAILFLTTKATVAYDFAIGMLSYKMTALNQGFQMSMASINGFGLAAKMANIGIMGMVGYAGLAVVALGTLAAIFQHTTHEAAALNAELNATGDRLTINDKKVTQAAIGLERYKQALADNNAYRQEVANAQYDREHGIKNFGNLFGLYKPSDTYADATAPRPEQFMKQDDYTVTKDNSGHVVVTIVNETGHKAKTSSTGNVKVNSNGKMPSVGQTGGFND